MTLARSFLVGVALLASACASSANREQQAQSGPTQPNWRDEAQKCYAVASQGRHVEYQGRTGIEACDRYVSQMREDEARRLEILREMMRENSQRQRDAQERFERSLRPPPEPTRCHTYAMGRSIYTDCNK